MKARTRSLLFLLVVIGLVAGSAVAIALRPTVLGLDLQGGVEVVLKGTPTRNATEVTPEAIQRTVDVIRNRVDRFGVAEPEIQTQGDSEIVVALPGAREPERVVSDLIKPAQLTFYDYEENLLEVPDDQDLFGVIQFSQRVQNVEAGDSPPSFYLFRDNGDHTLLAGPEITQEALLEPFGGMVPDDAAVARVRPGLVVLTEEVELDAQRENSPTQTQYRLLRDRPGLIGDDIADAAQSFDTGSLGGNEPIVTMQFTDAGRRKFADITREIARRGERVGALQSFAIVLDGEVISTPTIDFQQYPQGIDGRNGAQIQGNFTVSSARRLSDQINSGAIPIGLEVISLKQVSATLGRQSLEQGLTAGAVGLALVIVFLLAYYRLLGVIATFALLVYGALFYALVELIPITLTLPGIAGMILTIGVAADASVVIFERVREEARAGKSARAAVISGYSKGISAIIDANVVTLLTAGILFLFATAGVKGFAFTLLFGVILSLFTAVIATRGVFGLVADSKLFKNPRVSGLEQREIRWKQDFVGKWKLWLSISFVPIAIGTIFIAVNGLNLGLDFESGTRVTSSFGSPGAEQPSEDRVREVVSGLGYDAKIQATSQELDGRTVRGFQIQTESLQPDQVNELKATLGQELGGVNEDSYGVEQVGPTFGEQIIRNAIIAVILSFIVIILYLTIRFEYKLAVPALVSVIHDVWLTISIYSVTGREVTSATVAAILTILGYSLYDVVIVFDRIRENLPIMRRYSYREIVNRSVHETLTRSLITAFLTVLPVGVLLVFGGDTLKDFAFALLVGLLSGGISSIAIAAPLAALWKEREPEGKKRQARAKKRVRVSAGDADVADVYALARAEAALEGLEAERGLDDFEPAGLIDGPDDAGNGPVDEPPEREPDGRSDSRGRVSLAKGDRDGADPPDGDGRSPNGADAGPRAGKPPERVRRHRQVQRKKRR